MAGATIGVGQRDIHMSVGIRVDDAQQFSRRTPDSAATDVDDFLNNLATLAIQNADGVDRMPMVILTGRQDLKRVGGGGRGLR